MKSFEGWTPTEIINWKEKFDESYNDDGQLTLVSKETFKHEDDDILDFEYRYIIKGSDMYALGSGEHTIAIELYMEVLPQYVCKEKLDEILEGYGTTDIEDIWVGDLVDNGYGIRFGDEYISYNPKELKDGWYDYMYNLLDNEEVNETLNVCASVFEVMDRMRGFSLDRTWNMIGTTGWDTLRELLNGEDKILATINRWKENRKEA